MTGKVFMYGQCVSILYRNSRHELFSDDTAVELMVDS